MWNAISPFVLCIKSIDAMDKSQQVLWMYDYEIFNWRNTRFSELTIWCLYRWIDSLLFSAKNKFSWNLQQGTFYCDQNIFEKNVCKLWAILLSPWMHWLLVWSDAYVTPKLDIVVPKSGLSVVWFQTITWTCTGLLSIGYLGTYISEVWLKKNNFWDLINLKLF